MRNALFVAWSAFFVVGCGPGIDYSVASKDTTTRHTCITKCGVLVGAVPETCDEVNALEAKIVEAYSITFPNQNVCAALNGLTVLTVEGATNGHFISEGLPRRGVYNPALEEIQLPDVPLASSSLGHEIGHRLDYHLASAWVRTPGFCNNPVVMAEGCGESEHYKWEERGICDAIHAFNSDLPFDQNCPNN
jgi:hypothetical protein